MLHRCPKNPSRGNLFARELYNDKNTIKEKTSASIEERASTKGFAS